MLTEKEFQALTEKINEGCRRMIGLVVLIVPYTVGISEYQFYREFAHYWDITDETKAATVKRGLHRGVPKRLSCEQVIAGVEQIHDSHIADTNFTDEEERAKCNEAYSKSLKLLKIFYRLIEILNSAQKSVSENLHVWHSEYLGAITSGRFPKSGEGLTPKETEWLMAALSYYLPQKG